MSEHDAVGATATHAGTDGGEGLSVNTLKLLITSAIFLSALVSVLAPIIIIHKSESFFSIGNMMASGVLLAAALTHQLADATNTLNGALGSGSDGDGEGDDDDETYPWAMLICGLTFIAFLILEESVHLLLGESSHDHDSDDGGINLLLGAHSHDHKDHGAVASGGHDHSHGHGHAHDHGRRVPQSIPEEKTPLVGSDADRKREYAKRPSCSASHHGGIGSNGSDGPSPDNGSSRRSFRTYSKMGKSVNFADAFDTLELQELHGEDVDDEKSAREDRRSHHHKHRGETSILASIMDGSILIEDYNLLHSVHHHHDDHISQHLHGSTLASLMLFLALSLHSILEGVAIGIVPKAEMVVSTSAAILAHKAFAGYALGSTLITAESLDTRKHLYLGMIFSMTTPLGVLLGMALLDDFNGDSLAVGVVQAMVAGTFLYVSIVEVGTKELLVCRHGEEENVTGSVKRTEFLKLFAFLLGFLLMSGLAAFV